jgi:hypothetical protein
MPRLFREPSLADLLDDPLTSIVMARDGVNRDGLIALLNAVAKSRRGGIDDEPPGTVAA